MEPSAKQPLAPTHRHTCARKPAEQASPAPVHSCARERRLFTAARLANVARARRVDKRLHRRRRHLPPLAAPPGEDAAPAGLLRGGGVERRRSRRRERRAPADLDHHQGGDISPYLPHISPYLPTLTTTKVDGCCAVSWLIACRSTSRHRARGRTCAAYSGRGTSAQLRAAGLARTRHGETAFNEPVQTSVVEVWAMAGRGRCRWRCALRVLPECLN